MQGHFITRFYLLAGVEYGTQCYCGTNLSYGSTTSQRGYNMACSGNSSQICGGSSRLNVYNYTVYIRPVLVQQFAAYNVSNCCNDSSSVRTLGAYTWTSATAITRRLAQQNASGRSICMPLSRSVGNAIAAMRLPAPARYSH